MSRSDRDQRDAEQAARRARRLAERAEQRARRRTEQARRAAERADKLAERASRKRPGDKRFEDYVDGVVEDVADKWARKAEEWFDSNASRREDPDIAARRRARREAASARRAAESRAHRRRRRRSGFRPFRIRFNSGRGLYRDKARGKICGVCAGLADYLDVEVWQVRLIAVLGLVFAGQVAVPVYFIMYFLMDNKPYYRRMTDEYDDEPDDEDDDQPMSDKPAAGNGRRQPVVSPAMSNVEKLRVAKEKFSDLEDRLRSMESHVTSSRFELQRELRKISGDDA